MRRRRITTYVQGFIALADDAGVNELQVRDLKAGEGIVEGTVLSLGTAVDLVRRMLREELVCRLESPCDDFALHVGFDLYMYIGSVEPCERAEQRRDELGLFAEPRLESPQLVND